MTNKPEPKNSQKKETLSKYQLKRFTKKPLPQDPKTKNDIKLSGDREFK